MLQHWQRKLGVKPADSATRHARNGSAAPAPKWAFGADINFNFTGDGEAQPSVVEGEEQQAKALLERYRLVSGLHQLHSLCIEVILVAAPFAWGVVLIIILHSCLRARQLNKFNAKQSQPMLTNVCM